jgi:hypothetical protein
MGGRGVRGEVCLVKRQGGLEWEVTEGGHRGRFGAAGRSTLEKAWRASLAGLKK